jgi:OOP family OmpA-OmpF porin
MASDMRTGLVLIAAASLSLGALLASSDAEPSIAAVVPPRPASAPAAPIVPVCQPYSFLLFFGEGSARLDANNLSIVRRIAENARATDVRWLDVTGHANDVGSDIANEALSLRRANAVANELVRLGVEASIIHVRGAGSREPLVLEGKGDLGQNRRVEVFGDTFQTGFC